MCDYVCGETSRRGMSGQRVCVCVILIRDSFVYCSSPRRTYQFNLLPARYKRAYVSYLQSLQLLLPNKSIRRSGFTQQQSLFILHCFCECWWGLTWLRCSNVGSLRKLHSDSGWGWTHFKHFLSYVSDAGLERAGITRGWNYWDHPGVSFCPFVVYSSLLASR